MKIIKVLILVFFSGFFVQLTAAQDLNELIKPGVKLKIPPDLLKVYKMFVQDSKGPTEERLYYHCLPYTVRVNPKPREEKFRNYGSDINIPFLRKGFEPQLTGIEKVNDDVYQLGTLTSCLWYVRTKTFGWKIYRYEDGPQE